jgi:hypothetical protein
MDIIQVDKGRRDQANYSCVAKDIDIWFLGLDYSPRAGNLQWPRLTISTANLSLGYEALDFRAGSLGEVVRKSTKFP